MRPVSFSFLLFFAVLLACQPAAEKRGAAENPVESALPDTALAGRYLKQAAALIDSGEYDRALELAQKAETIFAALSGKEDITVADARYQLGRAWYFKRDYEKAKAHLEAALSTRRSVLGEAHSDVGRTLGILGNVCWRQRSFDLAIEYHQRALAVFQKSPDKNQMEIADAHLNLGNVYNSLGIIKQAIENYQKSLEFGKGHPLRMARACSSLGHAYWSIGDFDRAIQYNEQALPVFLSENSQGAISSYANMGMCYTSKGNNIRAIEYGELAIAGHKKSQKKDNRNLVNIYINIGTAYVEMGDYDRGIDYFRGAADFSIESGADTISLASIYNNIGTSYYRQGKDSLARHYYNLGKEMIETVPQDNKSKLMLATFYNNLGNIFLVEKNYGKAIEHQESSLKLIQKVSEQDHSGLGLKKAEVYNSMGSSYVLKEDYATAISCHRRALDIQLATLGAKHPDVAASYFNIGNCRQKSKNRVEAYASYQSALGALNYNKGHRLEEVNDVPLLINLLDSIGSIKRSWYHAAKSPSHLLESSAYYQEATAALDYQLKTLSPASKSDLAAQAHATYIGALSTNRLLHQLTGDRKYLVEGFAFAERSKSFLLYEAIHESNALAFAGIPDTLLRREYDLRVDIAFYEKRRQAMFSSGASGVDSAVLAVSNKLISLNRRYEALKKQLESQYPRYYRAKYDLSTIDIEGVQQNLLKPHQALLEYFVGDSSIFIFAIRPDTFQVVEVKKDFPLKDWVEDMRAGLLEPNTSGSNVSERAGTKKYAAAAHNIFAKIFQPVRDFLAGQRNLIVVPDGELGYVPFDALLSAAPENLDALRPFPFLLREHQISVSYSATLLREMRQKRHERPPSKIFLGVAPSFSDLKSELADRPASEKKQMGALENKEEVDKIRSLLGGDILPGTTATKQAFSEMAGKYRIIHLSTHGKANDQSGDYSYLAFSGFGDSLENGRLFTRELYNLRLNADLVVLSACETGIGELQRGEGIISLARGVSYAGAKSIVTTLWKVEDRATSQLMQRFYENLRKGMAKDSALHTAKLYLLDSTSNVSPYNWAAFVPIGDMEPMPLHGTDCWAWLLGLTGVAALAATLLWRRRKRAS